MTREYRGAKTEAEAESERGRGSAEASGAEAEVEKVKEQTCNLSGRLVHSKRVDKLKRNRNQTESLILAQDERWRRA